MRNPIFNRRIPKCISMVVFGIVLTFGMSGFPSSYDKLTYTHVKYITVYPSGSVSIVFEDDICHVCKDGFENYGAMGSVATEEGINRVISLATAAKLSGKLVYTMAYDDDTKNGYCILGAMMIVE